MSKSNGQSDIPIEQQPRETLEHELPPAHPNRRFDENHATTKCQENASLKQEDFRPGVELIHKQLQDVLQKLNVQRVPAQGQPFDPRVHEAIEMVESDEAPDNHVLEELQSGYRIKDRLLRPAMVRVAKKK